MSVTLLSSSPTSKPSVTISSSSSVSKAAAPLVAPVRECETCCGKFGWNGPTKRITCAFCNYTTCRKCTERYLTENAQDPDCMNCHKLWTPEFIHTTFTKQFYFGDLKDRREEILMDRETALLPATLAITEAVIEREAKTQEMEDELKELIQEQQELKIRTIQLNAQIRDIKNNIRIYQNSQAELPSMEKGERRQFVRSCPTPDCRGMLSSQWKCGLCNVKVCNKCHEIKTEDETHQCKPENIESAKLIMSETKPCPKCSSRISKNAGCDTMWCTACHTFFSWASLSILSKGAHHNPHYYEFMRKRTGQVERELGDQVCGGIEYALLAAFSDWMVVPPDQWDFIADLHAEILASLATYPTEQGVSDNVDLRVRYQRKLINRDQWKRLLQQREKKQNRLREEGQILRMMHQVMTDELTRATLNIRQLRSKKNRDNRSAMTAEVTRVYMQLVELRSYVNIQLVALSKRYNNVCAAILPTGWRLINTSILANKRSKASKKARDESSDGESDSGSEYEDE